MTDIDLTGILRERDSGDERVLDRVFPLVYEELRKLAHAQLHGQGEGRTLSTTALVHEAYLRLVDQTRATFKDRLHFYGYAARVMRSVLVDYARARGARKRGGGWKAVELEAVDLPIQAQADLMVAIDEALDRLARLDERLARVVECRFFGGLTEAETASLLGVTERTVRRDWIKARTWLHASLAEEEPAAD